MVFLHIGTALTWEETKKYADHVRYHGITQFLNIWNGSKDRRDKFLWGDEVRGISPARRLSRELIQCWDH